MNIKEATMFKVMAILNRMLGFLETNELNRDFVRTVLGALFGQFIFQVHSDKEPEILVQIVCEKHFEDGLISDEEMELMEKILTTPMTVPITDKELKKFRRHVRNQEEIDMLESLFKTNREEE